jgi:FAD/FMN-containing dehydrogenase
LDLSLYRNFLIAKITYNEPKKEMAETDSSRSSADETRNSAEFRDPGPVPILHWKSWASRSEKQLKPVVNSQHDTLEDALDTATGKRKKKRNVCVVTRMASHWALFEYKGSAVCKVKFRELQIGNMPLGGDPLQPETYLLDGKGKIAKAAHSDANGYRLEEIARPTEEPTLRTPWVDAVVPVLNRNHGRNEQWTPRFTLRPSLEELPSALAWVDQNLPKGTKIKAAGSLHSWSKTAVASSVYFAPWRMKLTSLIDEDENVYRPDIGEGRKNLVRVGSGVTVRELNRWLWLNGKSMPLLGGCDAQTVGGVLPTGTHGSVFTYGPMAELIKSIDLVLAGGRTVRIEPVGGITDAKLWKAAHPDVELIQKDDNFNAATINMGTMGVVASYMLEVTDKFHMREVRTLIKMDELREKLKDDGIYKFVGAPGHTPAEMETIPARVSDGNDGGFKGHPWPAYHLEIYINPHSDDVVITSRHPIAIPNDNSLGFTPPGRDLVKSLYLGPRFTRPIFPVWFQENFNGFLVWGLDTIITLFPKLTPFVIDRAMGTIIDKEYEDRSFNVFHNGSGQNRIPALIGTIFVPVEGDRWLEAIETIQEVAKGFAKRNRYVTAPASVRFVRGTKALLGVPQDYCSFEITYTGNTKYAQDDMEVFDLALRERFGEGGVWTHWGQLMRDPEAQKVRAMYKNYDRWRALRDELDAGGLFLNEWQERVLPVV